MDVLAELSLKFRVLQLKNDHELYPHQMTTDENRCLFHRPLEPSTAQKGRPLPVDGRQTGRILLACSTISDSKHEHFMVHGIVMHRP